MARGDPVIEGKQQQTDIDLVGDLAVSGDISAGGNQVIGGDLTVHGVITTHSLFEIDVDGGLMPVTTIVPDAYYELDSNDDIMPKAA